jgi:hypothetical protein
VKPTNGRTPRKGTTLNVEFRNGWKVGPYKVEQLVWKDRGQWGDVIAAEYVEVKDA